MSNNISISFDLTKYGYTKKESSKLFETERFEKKNGSDRLEIYLQHRKGEMNVSKINTIQEERLSPCRTSLFAGYIPENQQEMDILVKLLGL